MSFLHVPLPEDVGVDLTYRKSKLASLQENEETSGFFRLEGLLRLQLCPMPLSPSSPRTKIGSGQVTATITATKALFGIISSAVNC